MRSALIAMYHGSELSVPESSSLEKIWKSQTGERFLFWCTAMIFIRAYGQWFMPPLIVRQSENYTQDLQWNLPSDWLVHNTPSGYMDRYGWMNTMSLFGRTCVASKLNKQFLFFEGHDRHFIIGPHIFSDPTTSPHFSSGRQLHQQPAKW